MTIDLRKHGDNSNNINATHEKDSLQQNKNITQKLQVKQWQNEKKHRLNIE